MIKIFFKVVEATSDFQKAVSDFIKEAQTAYPELEVKDVATVPFTGRNTILKLTMEDDSAAQNEILPIEIFEDGVTPPSELDITDGKRYRDFTVNDDADLYTLKRISYNSPSSARLVMVISNATAPAAGETINFEISVNGGAAVTLSYVGLGTEAQNDVIVTDLESVSFGTGNYTVNIKRVAGTYAQEIGVIAVEVN